MTENELAASEDTLTLALAQHRVEAGDVSGNVDRAVAVIEATAARDADIVALPELFNVGYFAVDAYARAAEELRRVDTRPDLHGRSRARRRRAGRQYRRSSRNQRRGGDRDPHGGGAGQHSGLLRSGGQAPSGLP